MKLTNDSLFIERFNAGDEQAFHAVFSRYYKSLCSYIYGIVHDVDSADDIVQDIFMALWDRREGFNAVEKIASFLFISARHAALNRVQCEAARLQRLGEQMDAIAPDDVEETVLIAEFDAKLRRWLDALPVECRKVVCLALDGKKNAEIAEELALSVQTVKNQKVKGMKILRELYQQEYALLLLFIRLFLP